MTLREDLDKLASELAKRAMATDAAIAETTDALKVLTGYYALVLKERKDEPADDTTAFDFSKGIQVPEEHANGEARVPSRRGR